MENEENTAGTQQPTGQQAAPVQQQAAQVNNAPASGTDAEPGNTTDKPDRTFNRNEVTQILKTRLQRQLASICKKYGVESIKDLDALYEKHKDYDSVVTERDGLKSTNAEMTEKLAFLSNNIDPTREDDIRTYFKGKGLTFDEAILKEHLATHPEWVKQVATQTKPTTTVQTIGTGQQGQKQMTDKELAEQLYGMKF